MLNVDLQSLSANWVAMVMGLDVGLVAVAAEWRGRGLAGGVDHLVSQERHGLAVGVVPLRFVAFQLPFGDNPRVDRAQSDRLHLTRSHVVV